VVLWEQAGKRAGSGAREVTMRAVGGLIGLILAAGIALMVYKYYLSPAQSPGVAKPEQTIDGVGAQNDLLGIAQAERAYQAEHGKYASMDELTSSGAMTMKKDGRAGYTYEVDASDNGFRATARCDAAQSCQNYAVDQTMAVQPAP
jgi:hypothetical protein